MRYWNRPPREPVDVPCLDAFKARLDVALGNLIWWVAVLPTTGEVKEDEL